MSTLGRIAERLGREKLLRPSHPRLAALHEIRLEGISTDTRQVAPGWLFCAIRGTSSDGHRFLGQAAAGGVVAALVEERDTTLSLPQLEVRDGRMAAAYAAAEFYADPWNELTLVGVTGTNGKTTTAAILRHLLSTRGRAASIGTLGVVDAVGRVVPGTEALTTPGPVELAEQLRRLV